MNHVHNGVMTMHDNHASSKYHTSTDREASLQVGFVLRISNLVISRPSWGNGENWSGIVLNETR